jgi:serine/threonine-protein kinase
MSKLSLDAWCDALRDFGLVDSSRLEELNRALGSQLISGPDALLTDLIRRGWLTEFQVRRIVEGDGHKLVLGSYLILDRLGGGGMGEVYKARHRRLDRVVALKVIRPDRIDNPEVIARFLREAKLAARLSHPNIILVHDADQAGSTPFFAMEFVAGETLAQVLRRGGPLPIGQACDVIRQACLGLQHAHERGLVHRDIKPSNLLLASEGGIVKVLDLGLAFLNPAHSEEAAEPLTNSGVVMGTADYMAPEQGIDAHAVDIRADIYSLGCTFYHLLTGTPPFPGGTFTQKVLRHQRETAIPVDAHRPEIPSALADVVRTMMAREPARRFQVPAEVAAALTAFAQPAHLFMTKRGQGDESTPNSHPAAPCPESQKFPQPPTTPEQQLPGKETLRRRLPGRVIAVALVVVTAVAALLLSAGWPLGTRTTEPPAARVLIVGGEKNGPQGTFPTLRSALAAAQPGDHIQVVAPEIMELVKLDGDLLPPGVLVSGATPTGRPVVWRPPPEATAGDRLLELSHASDFRLRGFVLDGENRLRQLVRVKGESPGLSLEDSQLRGFREVGLSLANCGGSSDHPIVLRTLRWTASGEPASLLRMEASPDQTPRVLRHIRVERCRFEGLANTLIDVAAPLVDAVFFQNRLYQADVGVRYHSLSIDPRQRIEWALDSNTICEMRQAVLFMEDVPLAETSSRITVRNNLFARCGCLVHRGADPEAMDRSAQWVWMPQDDPNKPSLQGRRCFCFASQTAEVKTASLHICCDDTFTAWINGVEVGRSRPGTRRYQFDAKKGMEAATGVPSLVALECRNQSGSKGFLAELRFVTLRNNSRTTWSSSRTMVGMDLVGRWQLGDGPEMGWHQPATASVAHVGPTATTNVRDPVSREGNVSLGAAIEDFALPSQVSVEGLFLCYPAGSKLARAGVEGAPVGVPPTD